MIASLVFSGIGDVECVDALSVMESVGLFTSFRFQIHFLSTCRNFSIKLAPAGVSERIQLQHAHYQSFK